MRGLTAQPEPSPCALPPANPSRIAGGGKAPHYSTARRRGPNETPDLDPELRGCRLQCGLATSIQKEVGTGAIFRYILTPDSQPTDPGLRVESLPGLRTSADVLHRAPVRSASFRSGQSRQLARGVCGGSVPMGPPRLCQSLMQEVSHAQLRSRRRGSPSVRRENSGLSGGDRFRAHSLGPGGDGRSQTGGQCV